MKNLEKYEKPDLILIDGRFRVPLLFTNSINENDNCNYMFDDYLNRPFYMQLKIH